MDDEPLTFLKPVSKSSNKAKEKQVTMASATRSDNNVNASSSGGASMHGKVQSIVSENFAAETEGGSGSSSGRTVQGVAKKIQERKEKRLTSKIWNHFTRSFVDVREGDKVVKKKMAECHYCKIVLFADSSKGGHSSEARSTSLARRSLIMFSPSKFEESPSDHNVDTSKLERDGAILIAEHEVTAEKCLFPEETCNLTNSLVVECLVLSKGRIAV